ncbi:sigma factor [Paraburkholderia xenovorans]|uniref:sigma factor n=1 Tax=Paraburkholderia xenovorans TaxID=36873 RepID=UPI0038BA7D06
MLESRSTRKESPAAPSHIAAASDLARRRTRRLRDAEDVVEDAYLRAVRSFDGYHRDNARGWALAIRRNAWFTGWQRRRQMADGAPCDGALHGEQRLHGWPDDTGSDPQNFSVRRDGIHLPRQMPGAQSVEHREAVVLRDLEGLSDRENATVIDVPVGPINSRLSRDRALVFVAVRVVQAAPPHRPGEEFSDRSVVSSRAYPALQSAPSESVRGEKESSFSLAALGNQINPHATQSGYIDDLQFMMWMTHLVALLVVIRAPLRTTVGEAVRAITD